MTDKSPRSKDPVARAAWSIFIRRRTKRACASAFSLVEVSLALGIMGFAFVSILGLLPVGLTNFRDTKNVSVASQIAQQIFAEVQSTTFTKLTNNLPSGQSWRLPPPGGGAAGTALRYFDEQGQELSSSGPAAMAGAIYQVNVCVAASTPFVQNAAAGTTTAPNPALASVAIQIAYNPGNLTMDNVSGTYLWTGKSGTTIVPMFTYETLVARNS